MFPPAARCNFFVPIGNMDYFSACKNHNTNAPDNAAVCLRTNTSLNRPKVTCKCPGYPVCLDTTLAVVVGCLWLVMWFKLPIDSKVFAASGMFRCNVFLLLV